MSLADLPNELLFEVITCLTTPKDLSAFAQTNKHFYLLSNDKLYQALDKQQISSIFEWTAKEGKVEVAKNIIEKCKDKDRMDAIEAETPIIIAAGTGYIKIVELFLEHAFTNDSTNSKAATRADQFRSAVFCAVLFNHKDIVKLLFNFKPHINFHKHNFFSAHPLRDAARCQLLSMSKLLIKYGCDVNDRSGGGPSPLAIAVEKGHVGIVKLFLQKSSLQDGAGNESPIDAKYFRDLVTRAVRSGQNKVVKLLFNFKPHLGFYKRNFYAARPLLKAVRCQLPSMVKLLIRYGCDVNDRRKGGPTALTIASSQPPSKTMEMMQMIQILMDAGAELQGDPNVLLEALESENIELIQSLLERGSSPQQLSEAQILKEFSRMKRNSPQAGALLLSWLNVDSVIESGNHQRWALLKGAILHQFIEFLELLIKEKDFLGPSSRLERVRLGNCCPVNLAAFHHREEALQLLLDNGANPNGELGTGRSLDLALSTALNKGKDLETARILLERGVNRILASQDVENQAWIDRALILDKGDRLWASSISI